MAEGFITYKGFPLVRKGNEIYYGNMSDEYVTYMNVVSTANKLRNFSTFQTAATDVSSSAGSSAAIDVMTNGYPVVAYYDAANSKLKVVVAKVVKALRYKTFKLNNYYYNRNLNIY